MSILNLSGRRLFITGGTGFIGRTLLDFLITWQGITGQSFEVTVLSRQPNKFLSQHKVYTGRSWLSFVAGSLHNLPLPSTYSDVIHAAADTHLYGDGVQWVDQIVNGTATMLKFALESGAKRFLHVSSGAVYGPQPSDLSEIPENYAGAPSTALPSSTYGQAKRMAEQLCTIYFHEHRLHTVNARCFAFAGRHLPLNGPYALGNFIRDALHSESIHVKGDGTAIRSYLDGEDMAYWILSLLQSSQPGESYNIGSDKAITMYDLANLVSRIISPGKPVVVEDSELKSTHRSRYIPDIRKVAALGLVPNYDLAQAITRSVDGDA